MPHPTVEGLKQEFRVKKQLWSDDKDRLAKRGAADTSQEVTRKKDAPESNVAVKVGMKSVIKLADFFQDKAELEYAKEKSKFKPWVAAKRLRYSKDKPNGNGGEQPPPAK